MKITGAEVIENITSALGEGWHQPPRDRILIDDTHALMDQATCDALADYSGSFPSDVYPGKMWKRDGYAYRPGPRPERSCWFLVWYATHSDPGKCAIVTRTILIV